MYTNIRSWVKALIAWTKENYLDVDYYTNTHLGVDLPGGMLYINMTKPDSWRVSTLKNWSLGQDHIVVDEVDDRQLRIRRGPVGKLKAVRYSDDIGDVQKLTRASFDIAKLMDGSLRRSFLDHFMV